MHTFLQGGTIFNTISLHLKNICCVFNELNEWICKWGRKVERERDRETEIGRKREYEILEVNFRSQIPSTTIFRAQLENAHFCSLTFLLFISFMICNGTSLYIFFCFLGCTFSVQLCNRITISFFLSFSTSSFTFSLKFVLFFFFIFFHSKVFGWGLLFGFLLFRSIL